ncbi:uncharacterized protein A4U43_C10F4050 [Asparagus officinalis]|uniref:Peptidase S8/S53 domain-containing protein n=1 Tax=Asparagus officinalis TaxID=4686 RepID=A0A5P1E0J0_ASPOF|nr:uncharacterized protein A4U43_C10F4050 [Asparagus officinalis]
MGGVKGEDLRGLARLLKAMVGAGMGREANEVNSPKLINVTGKIVLCGAKQDYKMNVEASDHVKKAGGVAVIILSQWWMGNQTDADAFLHPASRVTYDDAEEIMKYLSQTSNPTAAIKFNGTQFGHRPAPVVSSFSNRGPNLFNGNIIKPDVIAPGSNILAAWPTEVGPNHTGTNKTFIMVSGTSMAAPHVSGIVALLKHNHQHWSPAAIKSAIMTTAYTKDRDGNPIKDQYEGENAGVFTMGSGHVDPVAANDPGLIYDNDPHDYIRFSSPKKQHNRFSSPSTLFSSASEMKEIWYVFLDEHNLKLR